MYPRGTFGSKGVRSLSPNMSYAIPDGRLETPAIGTDAGETRKRQSVMFAKVCKFLGFRTPNSCVAIGVARKRPKFAPVG